MDRQRIASLFKENNGYLSKTQLPDRATYYQVLSMVAEGVVERVKNGLFYLEDAVGNPTMIDVDKVVPGGVLCLYSAWFYYGLTTQIPQAYHVAIEKSRKLTLPDYPPIRLYYWKRAYHRLGVIEKEIDGYGVNIYSLEKTVCDAVRFRNKIGMEVMAEIVRNYLGRKDRNLTLLMEFAGKLRVAQVLKTYMDIQL